MIKSPYESTSWLWRVWANICDDGRLNRATEREKGWVNVDVKNGRKKRDSVSFSWFFDYSWLERVARSFGCLFLSYTSRVCWRWGGLMLWTKQLIIHPTIGAFLFLFFHWRRREEKRGTTGRRVIFSVLCCYVMASSHLLLVSFYFYFWGFCCWDVMEFQMSFWGQHLSDSAEYWFHILPLTLATTITTTASQRRLQGLFIWMRNNFFVFSRSILSER